MCMYQFFCYFSSAYDPLHLYIANRNMIVKFELNTTNGEVINNIPEKLHNSYYSWILSIAVDEENSHLYCFNRRNFKFMKMTTNGSMTKTLFTTHFGYVEGITVDWSSNVLYWTDTTSKAIEVAKTNGKYRNVLFKFDYHSSLYGIVADPTNG